MKEPWDLFGILREGSFAVDCWCMLFLQERIGFDVTFINNVQLIVSEFIIEFMLFDLYVE